MDSGKEKTSRAPARMSVFERHPRLTVFGLLVVTFFTIDLVLTYATTDV